MPSKSKASKPAAKKSGGLLGFLQERGKAKMKSANEKHGGGARKRSMDDAIDRMSQGKPAKKRGR